MTWRFHRQRTDNLSDFAVGFSRQPLPKGTHFVIVTNADGAGVNATDATNRANLDPTILRPELVEVHPAKCSPTATISTSEEALIGFHEITNGVKQTSPGQWLLGVDSFSSGVLS
jgi:hypothetical protein